MQKDPIVIKNCGIQILGQKTKTKTNPKPAESQTEKGSNFNLGKFSIVNCSLLHYYLHFVTHFETQAHTKRVFPSFFSTFSFLSQMEILCFII